MSGRGLAMQLAVETAEFTRGTQQGVFIGTPIVLVEA